MTDRIPLRIGSLAADGYETHTSGIRWLVPDGHPCQPGELIAWCRIAINPTQGRPRLPHPFATESGEVQVAFAPRTAGRLVRSPDASRGGWHDIHTSYRTWNPEGVLGHLQNPASHESSNEQLRLLFVAGRKVLTDATDSPFEFLSGWHDRLRAWWADTPGTPHTVLSLGTCEQFGLILGERGNFREWFSATPGPAQMVFQSDIALVPSSPVLLANLSRTPAELHRLASDIAHSYRASAGDAVLPLGAGLNGWLFLNRLITALADSPLTDRPPVLGREGLTTTGPPGAVLLSLSSEPREILRHRRLGYPIWVHPWRIVQGATDPVKAWLRKEFEVVPRSPDEIGRDLRALFTAIRDRTGARVFILNGVSTMAEDIITYAGFDPPLRNTLASVRSKEMNLMLANLTRDRSATVIDVDALAAEFGTAEHLPDGFHGSGPFQNALRAELLAALRMASVPGFGTIN